MAEMGETLNWEIGFQGISEVAAGIEEAEKAFKRLGIDTPEMLARAAEEMANSAALIEQAYGQVPIEIERAVKAAHQKLEDQTHQTRAMIMRWGDQITGDIGAVGRGMSSTLKGLVPMGIGGGLIGLLLGTLAWEDNMRSQTTKFVNMVQRMTGEAGGAVGVGVADIQQQFAHLSGGLEFFREDVKAIYVEFAKAGVGFDETGKVVKDSFAMLSRELDYVFEVASGTSAKAAIEIMHGYGGSIEEATGHIVAMRDEYLEMDGTVKNLHMSKVAFMNLTIQTASSMKQLGIEFGQAREMASAFMKVGGGLGIGEGRLAEMVPGVGRAIAGLPLGLQALIGGRMAGGEAQEGAERIAAFRGIGPGGEETVRDMLATTLEYFQEYMKEAGGGARGWLAAELGPLGVPMGQARVLEQFTPEDLRAIRTEGIETKEITKEQREAFKALVEGQKDEKDIMAELKAQAQKIAQIMSNLLAIIMDGLAMLTKVGMIASSWLAGEDIEPQMKQLREMAGLAATHQKALAEGMKAIDLPTGLEKYGEILKHLSIPKKEGEEGEEEPSVGERVKKLAYAVAPSARIVEAGTKLAGGAIELIFKSVVTPELLRQALLDTDKREK